MKFKAEIDVFQIPTDREVYVPLKRKGEARRRRKKKTLIPMAEMSKRTKESVLVLRQCWGESEAKDNTGRVFFFHRAHAVAFFYTRVEKLRIDPYQDPPQMDS